MKTHFRQKFMTDREEVIFYLEAMKQGFKDGLINFDIDEEYEVELEPPKFIEMSVETCLEKGNVILSINFSWPDEGPLTYPPEKIKK
jgi:amphi-Trp domain-containing protein